MTVERLRECIAELGESQTDDGLFGSGYKCGIKCALMYVDVFKEHMDFERKMAKIKGIEYPYGRNDYQE